MDATFLVSNFSSVARACRMYGVSSGLEIYRMPPQCATAARFCFDRRIHSRIGLAHGKDTFSPRIIRQWRTSSEVGVNGIVGWKKQQCILRYLKSRFFITIIQLEKECRLTFQNSEPGASQDAEMVYLVPRASLRRIAHGAAHLTGFYLGDCYWLSQLLLQIARLTHVSPHCSTPIIPMWIHEMKNPSTQSQSFLLFEPRKWTVLNVSEELSMLYMCTYLSVLSGERPWRYNLSSSATHDVY